MLRSELTEVWVESTIANEGRSEAEAREGIDGFVDKLINAMRVHSEDFLMVAGAVEAQLSRGESIQDSEQRIVRHLTPDARSKSLVRHLIDQHEAVTITPIRKELLAHFLAAHARSDAANPQQ